MSDLRRLIVAQTIRKALLFLLGLLPVALLAYTFVFQRDLFPLAFVAACLLAFLWILGNIVASIVYRKRCGKYVLTPRFPDALFTERWLSGRGHKRFLFQRPGASNCLWLAIMPDRLMVAPMFPFNLMFLPERLGIEYDLPASNIVGVTKKSLRFGRSIATVRFRLDTDTENELDLMVRDMDGFMSAMTSITESKTPSVHPPLT